MDFLIADTFTDSLARLTGEEHLPFRWLVALRAVVFHQGRAFVGGDNGVVLTSADGVVWSAAAPTSFGIRGLASSGNALVAVGSYDGAGRLQASLNGLTWPGSAVALSAPLIRWLTTDLRSWRWVTAVSSFNRTRSLMPASIPGPKAKVGIGRNHTGHVAGCRHPTKA